jgi:hypothetical protein
MLKTLVDEGTEIKMVNGHIEIYIDGVFQFSADTMGEALEEIAINDETLGRQDR